VAYPGLNAFIERLHREGELLIIDEPVNPVLEITEITDRVSKQPGGGKALLFTNTGTPFPILINSMGSIRRMCLALGSTTLDEPGERVRKLISQFASPGGSLFSKLKMLPKLRELSLLMPRTVKGRGSCQEVIIQKPDLSVFPILKCWPYDGGRFITLPLVHTIDPESGIRNVGMYRMQLFSSDETGMHWHRHKTGARHFEAYKRLGKKMPVAVALGGDPVYTYAATAPLPDNMDEYMFAGFLRGEGVKLVKCISQEIEVPADADIIIEGYIDPMEEQVIEGPFGDHTGFYSMPDLYPRFHVTCITHRRNAVYPATIVGIPPQEDAWIALATERIFLVPLQLTVLNELVDMDLPQMGVAHNLAVVKIHKTYPGQAVKVMNALWGAGQMMFNKFLIIVDGDTNVHDYSSVIHSIITHTRISDDIHLSNGPLDVLDHSSTHIAFGGKLAIDATKKLPEEGNAKPSGGQVTIPSEVTTAIDESYPGYVAGINRDFVENGIPVLFIRVKNERPAMQVIKYELAALFAEMNEGCLVIIDEHVDLREPDYLLWYCLNNIDPARDCSKLQVSPVTGPSNILFIDACIKDRDSGYAYRSWPNAICSDDQTINSIDRLWDKLKIGNFTPSPSLKFKGLVRKSGPAV
jgi:4-hydroxy-3-polyprenylbenzoate decarboxylase